MIFISDFENVNNLPNTELNKVYMPIMAQYYIILNFLIIRGYQK
ncbi:hypothetical protein HJ01_00489 [Flavobacterium frigoris PS1]|uniref:Uncharacterized protein n=1 Tax=Flavobacterium frigoris (strain PS1) TaxID=1086011 RepID=H7FMU2_FLAFP|nr:hypothetical protein HJ01_00489 [Flavobacterium frigoris PS1]